MQEAAVPEDQRVLGHRVSEQPPDEGAGDGAEGPLQGEEAHGQRHRGGLADLRDGGLRDIGPRQPLPPYCPVCMDLHDPP